MTPSVLGLHRSRVGLLLLALLACAAPGWAGDEAYTYSTLAGGTTTYGLTNGPSGAAQFNQPFAIARLADGTVYVADTENNAIRVISPAGDVSTLAGSPDGVSGSADGTRSAARFNGPRGIAVNASTGVIYVADTYNHTIRAITSAGVVTTLAGQAGTPDHVDGTGDVARFYSPNGIACDGNGRLYVADSELAYIRLVTAAGVVTTLAGTGTLGNDDGPVSTATLQNPIGIAVNAAGTTVLFCDNVNQVIRKINVRSPIADSNVETVAGLTGTPGVVDGVGNLARFDQPWNLVMESDTIAYVVDAGNSSIRRLDIDNVAVPAVATVTTLAGMAGFPGLVDGTGTAARFYAPTGIVSAGAGDLLVADAYNSVLRRVFTTTGNAGSGVVTTVAGVGRDGRDGTGAEARFYEPRGIAVDAAGTLVVADTADHVIRRVTTAGVVTTIAGTARIHGTADGTGAAAQFDSPRGLAVSGSLIYVADTSNHTIRCIDGAGVVTTLAGSPNAAGNSDGSGTAARFNNPQSLCLDPDTGNLFVSEFGNHRIRLVTPGGVVTTIAGNAGMGASDGDATTEAMFNGPGGMAFDRSNHRLYIADNANHAIRCLDTQTGQVTTVAGTLGLSGSADGQGTAARFQNPLGVALDDAGNLLVVDRVNHTIRRISPSGLVSTVGGSPGHIGNTDGVSSAARFYYPAYIAIDGRGRLFVTETHNNSVRLASAAIRVTTPVPSTTASRTIPVTIVFSSRVIGTPTITATNATVGALTSSDQLTWTVTLTATSPGAVEITSIAATDAAGAYVDNTVHALITYETGVAVSVEQAAGQADPASASPLRFTVTFAEPIDPATFVSSDVTVGGTAGAVDTVVITPVVGPTADTTFAVALSGIHADGTVTVAIAANQVQTPGGANCQDSTSVDNTVTWVAPSGSAADSSDGSSCGAGNLAGLLVAMLGMFGLRRRRG